MGFRWRLSRSPILAGTSLFRWAYGTLNFSFVIARSAWGDRRSLVPGFWDPYLAPFVDRQSRQLVLWALAKAMTDSASYCESLWRRRGALADVPMQFIWGMKDSAFPASALDRLRDAFPRAEVRALPSAGHWPHLEQPDTCVSIVERFLDRLS